jgi:hypothetical protein
MNGTNPFDDIPDDGRPAARQTTTASSGLPDPEAEPGAGMPAGEMPWSFAP